MNELLDIFLTFLHLVIIGFNLLGWIWSKTRKMHLIVVGLTLGSWLILGIWYGLGYCPITDWQWQVKTAMGETNLPSSFVKYYADKLTGLDISPGLIDVVTIVTFTIAIFLSLYLNLLKQRDKR